MNIQIYIITILLLFSLTLKGEKKDYADSLKNVVMAMPNDSNKVKALNDVAFEYRNSNPKKTIQLAKEALTLGKKLNYEWDLPRSLNFVGVGYQKMGEQAPALEYFTKAKDLSLKIRHIEQLGYSYHNMGTIHNWQNNYEKAIELFYKSLKIFEQLEDLKGIAYIHNSLSLTSLSQGNLEMSIKHANETLKIRQKINDKRGQGAAYNRLGEIYIKKEDYNHALRYFFKNIRLYESMNDLDGLAFTNMNIAKVYLNTKDYTKAVYFSKKCVEYYDTIGNNGVVAEALLLMGEALYCTEDYPRSERYAQKAIAYAKEYNRQEVLFNSYFLLSKIAETEKKYSQALAYHKQYVALKDSLFDADMYMKSGWQQGSFAIFKKEQENDLLKQKEAMNQALIQKQKIQQWSLLVGLMLISILAIVLVRSIRRKRKDYSLLEEKNREIEKQKMAIVNKTLALATAQQQLQDYNEQLEQKVEERTNALQKSNEELELYAYMASHDLKQPLRNIAGFSQLIIRHLNKKNLMDDTIKDFTKFIVDNTQYMHNLIEDLLTFSKFSSNSHQASFETVKYSEVLEVVLQNLHQQIQDTNANIVLLNIPETGEGLKIKLMQLFQNLISNSLKFSKKDTPAVICIDSVDTGTYYQFSVADNGIGISKEYFDLIFETFKKLHNKQEYAGVGLGLSTCKKIVEQHNGKIWLESTLNEGTTFYFTIAKKH